MNSERWRQIERLYHAALEREPCKRRGFLAEACECDDDLRLEVEALLAQDESTNTVLEHPAVKVVAPAQLAAGSLLGRYLIESAIGAGGMGEVYRARDTRLDRTVAIKVAKEDFTERFEREARAIAALNHPN